MENAQVIFQLWKVPSHLHFAKYELPPEKVARMFESGLPVVMVKDKDHFLFSTPFIFPEVFYVDNF